ncbi:MAG: hypothetical protein WBR26_03065 [Candidatus Acidiferrum sp.]
MKKAAVGFRVHSGWCAVVAVCLENGRPRVLLRERPHLVEEFTYKYRQPYHTAEKMSSTAGREFIHKARTEATSLACQTIVRVQSSLEPLGYQLTSGALLLAAARPLPELAHILASHALIHTADGELFRDAISRAHVRHEVPLVCMKERELDSEAAQCLRLRTPALRTRLTELGKPFGSPWSQDEKFAALAAWLALSGTHQNAPHKNRKLA